MIKEKVKLIEIINRELVKAHREPLSVREFDILYDLELDELYHTTEQVQAHLLTAEPH